MKIFHAGAIIQNYITFNRIRLFNYFHTGRSKNIQTKGIGDIFNCFLSFGRFVTFITEFGAVSGDRSKTGKDCKYAACETMTRRETDFHQICTLTAMVSDGCH